MEHHKFGKHSLIEMEYTNEGLVEWTERALFYSRVDFGVFDGLRTAVEQNKHYRRGQSQIDGYERKSKHQTQDDGTSHAVDLVPWVDGKWTWRWGAIYQIANAGIRASKELDIDIRWGGCWQNINQLPLLGAYDAQRAYVERKLKQGRRAFTDGPHFELL